MTRNTLSVEHRAFATPHISIAVALSLVLVGLGMAVYNEQMSNAQKLRDVSVQAHILAGAVAAPLAFDDRDTTREYVNALQANPDVEAAGVYQLGGRLEAGFVRSGGALPAVSQFAPPRFEGDHLLVTATVAQGRTLLGSVYLRTARESLARRVARYSGIALLIVMAALLVARLGASNASLIETHDRLRLEMDERRKAEQALLESQKLEALAQLEVATERGRAALRQSELQLEVALEAGRLGSWTLDLVTGQFTASAICELHFGLNAGAPQHWAEQLIARIHPQDREHQLHLIEQAIQARTLLDSEFRTLSPEGDLCWILIRGRADYDQHGVAQRIAGVSMDISARKAAEEHQRLLLDELNHRVKNTLATVLAIAQQTGGGLESPSEFKAAFMSRISALARVHDLLTKVAWEGASLSDVVAQTLAPHRARGDNGGLILSGPAVRLAPNAAVTLTMAFHELATNAAKYGALSVKGGHVEVSWTTDRELDPTAVEIRWRETGGPSVAPPSRRGFGSRFLERSLAREFDGAVSLSFAPGGVVCLMRLPLSIKLRLAA